ncbi:MAG: cupin domain-containing protein [Chloroflexota bacterium]
MTALTILTDLGREAIGTIESIVRMMTDAAQIVRTLLAAPALAEPKVVDHVQITEIVLPPAQATGLHTHPIPVVGYVQHGSVLVEVEGLQPQQVQAGQAFYEPANTTIRHCDNLSTTEAATFIAFYLLGKDDHEVIRLLQV